MRKEINELIAKELFEIDENDKAGTYDKQVHVLHQDGSEYKVQYARVEKRKIRHNELTVVFCEHNTVNVFVDTDLEFVKVKPWKGREYKVKLQTDAEWDKLSGFSKRTLEEKRKSVERFMKRHGAKK